MALLAFLLAGAGCRPAAKTTSEVVVYAAPYPQSTQPIFQQFSDLTQISTQQKFVTKTGTLADLTDEILAGKDQPRCDVFWDNEILQTLRLDRAGLLDSFKPTQAGSYSDRYRSARGTWNGFAARARVLLVNKDKLAEDDRPKSIHDLADPKWKGQVGLAKPLTGTSATHAACLFAAWGPEKAEEFFRQLKQNAVILDDNQQVAQQVADGTLVFGLTDSDVAMVNLEGGQPVAIVYPDQEPGGLGMLFIPNTVAILKKGAHPQAARELVDYLLTSITEKSFAKGPDALIPLNRTDHDQARLPNLQGVRPMLVDFDRVGEMWDAAAKFLESELAAK